MRMIKIYSGWLFILFSCAVFAEEMQMQYKQHQLPNGDTVTEYSSSDGTKIKQTHQPNGTIITEAVDAEGNQTTAIQRPDGSSETKTKTKQ